jgi:hypothetical protein
VKEGHIYYSKSPLYASPDHRGSLNQSVQLPQLGFSQTLNQHNAAFHANNVRYLNNSMLPEVDIYSRHLKIKSPSINSPMNLQKQYRQPEIFPNTNRILTPPFSKESKRINFALANKGGRTMIASPKNDMRNAKWMIHKKDCDDTFKSITQSTTQKLNMPANKMSTTINSFQFSNKPN